MTHHTNKESAMKVSVLGPNLPANAGATFHVHAAGCADIHRSPMYRRIDPPWDVEVRTIQDVVEAVMSDIIDENPDLTWESYTGEFKVFPCVHLEV